MKPLEAGFDGAKGINLGQPHMKGGGMYLLKRGKTSPPHNKLESFKNQLIWYYPDEQEPKLLYCNDNGEWFNLSFEPIDIANLD